MRFGAWFVKCNIAVLLRIMYIMLNKRIFWKAAPVVASQGYWHGAISPATELRISVNMPCPDAYDQFVGALIPLLN